MNKIKMSVVIKMDQLTTSLEEYCSPSNSDDEREDPRPNAMLIFAKNNFVMLQSRTEDLKSERTYYKTKTKLEFDATA